MAIQSAAPAGVRLRMTGVSLQQQSGSQAPMIYALSILASFSAWRRVRAVDSGGGDLSCDRDPVARGPRPSSAAPENDVYFQSDC